MGWLSTAIGLIKSVSPQGSSAASAVAVNTATPAQVQAAYTPPPAKQTSSTSGSTSTTVHSPNFILWAGITVVGILVLKKTGVM